MTDRRTWHGTLPRPRTSSVDRLRSVGSSLRRRARRVPLPGRVRPPRVRGRDLLPILAVVAVAATLRLWRLDAVGFRGDEAVYAGQAALLAGVDDMHRWFILASRGNSNFLVFQWILSLCYRVGGVDDLTARLLSAGFSVATVALVYAVARLLHGHRSAFFAALAIAVSGYAVSLGRLALLDPTLTFFVVLAVTCLAAWYRLDRTVWLCGFAAATAVALQAKVTAVLLIPTGVAFVLASGAWRRLSVRGVAAAAAVGACFLVPAAFQLVTNTGHVTEFLSTSTQRASAAPWYYYAETLWSRDGTVMTVVVGASLLRAVVRRSRDDLLPALWLVAFLAFLQLYPLKAFNYLLPVTPALALFVGRAAAETWGWLGERRPLRSSSPGLGTSGSRGNRGKRDVPEGEVSDGEAPSRWLPGRWTPDRELSRRPRVASWAQRLRVGGLAAGALVVALVVGTAPSVYAAMHDDGAAGLREAARWLQRQGLARAGVMTMSHGSAQYVLSFYGGVDAYPFGRFRLDTVVPGGKVAEPRPHPDGELPRDWVSYWPPRLIQGGEVSYLVYHTGHLDDPPEQDQVAGTMTERKFRGLIETYGGKLVHRVYWNHEARVYIYQVAKRLPRPEVRMTYAKGRLSVVGRGFMSNSPVTVTYHNEVIGHARTDEAGAVSVAVPMPRHTDLPFFLHVVDSAGNDASVNGLPPTEITHALRDGRVVVRGSGYSPGAGVTVSYHQRPVGKASVGKDGRFTFAFPLPAHPRERYWLRATDTYGRTASVTGLGPAGRSRR